jgi:hypothetical protein
MDWKWIESNFQSIFNPCRPPRCSIMEILWLDGSVWFETKLHVCSKGNTFEIERRYNTGKGSTGTVRLSGPKCDFIWDFFLICQICCQHYIFWENLETHVLILYFYKLYQNILKISQFFITLVNLEIWCWGYSRFSGNPADWLISKSIAAKNLVRYNNFLSIESHPCLKLPINDQK